jgi:pimeloyl-ACP methyl ester carboxylesterase
VLLAGSGGNALMWFRHVSALGERHSVYAVDTMGDAGHSIQRVPIRDGNDGAAWLRELLEGLAIPRAHLVGCSYGGWLALHHAIHAPARTAETLMPSAHSEIVPGAGHALPVERPDLTAARISEFVQRHP